MAHDAKDGELEEGHREEEVVVRKGLDYELLQVRSQRDGQHGSNREPYERLIRGEPPAEEDDIRLRDHPHPRLLRPRKWSRTRLQDFISSASRSRSPDMTDRLITA